MGEFGVRPLIYYYNDKVYKGSWFKNIKLEFDDTVYVGIDQSSTSTGICITDFDYNLFMADFVRDNIGVGEYRRALKEQLEILTMSHNIRFFLYEEHGRHIAPVASVINTVTDTLKQYSKKFNRREIETHGILPPVWRSGFLPKQEFHGRFERAEVKKACVEKAIQLVPSLEIYKKYCNEGFDSFEAFGIASGFRNLNFDKESGLRIVNRCLKQHHGRDYTYIIRKVSIATLDDEITNLRKAVKSPDCPIVLANPSIRLEESCNRISGLYRECILVYKSCLEYSRLVLEYGEPLNVGEETFIIYVRRR